MTGSVAAGAGTRGRRLLGRLARDVAALVVVALLLTLVFGVAQGTPAALLPAWFVIMLVVTTSFGVTITLLYELAYPPLRRRARGLHATAAVHVLLVGGGSLLATEIAARALGFVRASVDRPSLLLVGLGVSSVMVALHVSGERLRERAREAELRSRLETLQSRTNPHFLFNSLNVLAGLIREDPERAERLVERLSGVFRHALERGGASWIRLEDELEAVRDYLEVESIRLEGRLAAEVRCDPDAAATLVPPMLVQPLVENAVLHGVAGLAQGGRVSVQVERVPEGLRVLVEDDGPGPGRSDHRGSGTSLATLRERLELVYRGQACLELSEVGDGGCRAALTVPAGAREEAS